MPSTPIDSAPLRRHLNDHLRTAHDDAHEHERTLARTQLVFDLFYDDEPSEPQQAIGDALTDLMHLAAQREVDFELTLSQALRRWVDEREEWGLHR